MKKELLELGFTEEQVESIVKVVGKSNVPLDRFNEVNETKKQLEKDVKERNKQLEELKKANASNEELKTQITNLQETNKKAEENFKAELSKIKLDNAIENALIGAKSKNNKAVKALLNLENIKLENDSLVGLDEQLKVLQSAENSKFLFEEVKDSNKTNISGIQPGVGNTNNNETRPLTYSEMLAGK